MQALQPHMFQYYIFVGQAMQHHNPDLECFYLAYFVKFTLNIFLDIFRWLNTRLQHLNHKFNERIYYSNPKIIINVVFSFIHC